MGAASTTEDVGKRTRETGGFWYLIATQFQGAFNDNLFKYIVIFFIVDLYVGALEGPEAEALTGAVSAWATVVFSLPFIIFPGIFGALSDRYSKQVITVWAKYIEVAVMLAGAAAFALGTPRALWALLFCMAAQSAFFSPSKYGILPEILPESRLAWGNGMLGLWTMVAIIAGVGVAGPLYDGLPGRTYLAGLLLAVLSCAGVATSYGITRPAPADPGKRLGFNPWTGMAGYFRAMTSDRVLFVTLVGYTYFWFSGVFVQQNLIPFGKVTLNLSFTQNSVMQACLAFGIGVGSAAAGYLSKGKIELGLVPLALGGLALCSGLLALTWQSYAAVLVLLALLGFFGGAFSVPLAAAVQHRSPAHAKGGAMATANLLTFSGMLVAGGLYWVLVQSGVSTRQVFLLAGLISVGVAAYMLWALPYLLLRCFIWTVITALYRLRVAGRERVPHQGGAMLASNHVSFVDTFLIMAAIDRPVTFLMYRPYAESWWMKPARKFVNVIPVATTDGHEALAQALQRAGEAVQGGQLLCVFPEGSITRTGHLLPFQKGYERIMKGVDAPIVPVHLDNVWGSIFSFAGGRFFTKWPSLKRRRITVSFGAPLPPTTTPYALRCAVQNLGTDAHMDRKLSPVLLGRSFIHAARRRPRLICIGDARSGPLNYFKTLAGGIVLARKLKRLLGPAPMVGVLVPPTVGGALTNLALQFMGRVAVNLNYTASAQTLASAARTCKMTHCVTAREFLARVPVTVPAKPVYLEDILRSVTAWDRALGAALALACPVRVLEWLLGAPRRRPDDVATVIFSSGSEGEPKGVMLTHFNITSNAEAFAMVVPHDPGEVMMGFLPFFHSFGFTATLWGLLPRYIAAVYHPNPLEPKAIAEVVQRFKARFLIGTPTFLQNFVRRCTAEELSSLRLIVAGAEKLTPRIRDAFQAKFGKEPLEGYGTTECSPVVAVNTPDYQGHNILQRGSKRGTVGMPLPGMSVRTVHPETGEVLGPNEPGMLEIRGPNIMKGYLEQPDKTAAVFHDGWYITGDVAIIDDEGFITITDRLARFSKIVGEMVSHTKVEDTLHELLGLTELTLAVASVPDHSRGERLVVLHTLPDGQVQELVAKLERCELPNLWRPRANAFHRVDAIPVLGTGKLDLKALKVLAAQVESAE